MFQIKRKFNTELEQAGLKVVKLLHASNFQAFWVGGVVRNILLKRESDNIDIATDATPDEIEDVLNRAKITHKPVGKQFGSILAIVKGWKIEITTFRAEGRYSDKRHPDEVTYIRAYIRDAARRDFTINALYLDPVKKMVYDPVNGISNLESRILKFVGDPKKRLEEDALRMLRGVRLATQLGFKLERNSFAAIKTRAKYIQGISGERIKAELDKILLSPNRVEGIRLLDQVGLLKFIIPELPEAKKYNHHSRFYHLEGDVFTHTLLVLEYIPDNDLILAYAALFHDTGKVYTRIRKLKDEGWVYGYHGHEPVSHRLFLKFAVRLKFSRQERDLVAWLIEHHGEAGLWEKYSDTKKISYALHPDFPSLLLLWRADSMGGHKQLPDGSIGPIEPKRYREGLRVLKSIRQVRRLIEKLANGDMIMKYSNFKPSRELGQKILDVKVQIILGKIKNVSDLKKRLDKREQ